MNADPVEVETTQIIMRPATGVSQVSQALGVNEILAQVRLIQEVMSKVMHEGEHYGAIPGCGAKKTLLQPGAQKLTMTFRLAPSYEIQETDVPHGHKEYRVICTLKTIQNGTFVGQGVGCCSSLESKYRWRSGEGESTGYPVPKEYWSDRDPTKLGGKEFFAKKVDGQWIIHRKTEKVENDNPADTFNCISPDTRLLTHDLQWIPAGEIQSGDMLIGVAEEGSSDPFGRSMAIGEATVHGRKIEQLYEVAFEDGRTVRCNGEHRWLVKKIGLKGTEWASTQDIYAEIAERQGRPRHWSVMSLCHPWTEDSSKEAGYIAGLLDADGSLGTAQILVMFAQQENIVLGKIQSALESRGFALSKDAVKADADVEDCISKKHVFQLRVRGGFTEQMRALGTIRPPRLLERWLTLIDLSKRRLENRYCPAAKPARIASVAAIGEGEIVLLGTSCHTYFAEGLACHNTVLKMAKKRAFVDATITATAASDIFTQDIGDDEGAEPSTAAETDSKPNQEQTTKCPKTAPKQQYSDRVTPDGHPDEIRQFKSQKKARESRLTDWLEQCKREWLKRVAPIEEAAHEYATKIGWILPTETLADVRTEKLFPGVDYEASVDDNKSLVKQHFDGIMSSLQRFMDGDQIPDAEVRSEAFWDVIVPVPHAGEKRNDYLKNPDTIRSLYDATKSGDANAQKRLFGFANHYQPSGWTKKDGTTMPPGETDIKFREALDEFLEWEKK